MLKTRIIAVVVVKNGIAVQSICFDRYLPIGSPAIAVEYLDKWGISEIVLLDIDATSQRRTIHRELVEKCARKIFVPLTVGGGIGKIEDIEECIRCGADKVSLNWTAVNAPELISQGARLFGSQCIVVSIDARQTGAGCYEAVTHSGKRGTGMSPVELAKRAEDMGAGEILINSTDRDGSKKGYDHNLYGQVLDAVGIPVIVCGGVGHPAHFLEAIRGGASAVAAANFFHFTEHSVILASSYLKAHGADVRMDTYAKYDEHKFGANGRTTKRDDDVLADLLFEYLPEEII